MLNNEQILFKIECSIYLLKHGLTIFPLHGIANGLCTCGNKMCSSQGKHPLYKDWQTTGHLTSVEEIRQFWQLNPYHNYGVLMRDILVIDVDERNSGAISFEQFVRPCLADVNTMIVQTGSGGCSMHIYFLNPLHEIKGRVSWFKGIDIKSAGGYVVGPGSFHVSGNTYNLISWGAPDRLCIAQLPEQLRELIKSTENMWHSSKGEIKANLIFGGTVKEGMRNSTLTSYGGGLVSKGLKLEEIQSLLLQKNSTFEPPLNESEVLSICKSINRYADEEAKEWEAPNYQYSVQSENFKDIDIEIIPYFFKNYVQLKKKSIGVPMSAIMVSLLTIISAILGAAFKIKQTSNSEYEETLNLWGMIVAPPSSRKTSVLNILKRVLADIDDFFLTERLNSAENTKKKIAKLEGELKEECNDRDEKAEVRLKISKLKSETPPYWLFVTNDTNTEALGRAFKDNHRGVLLFKDELEGLMASLTKLGFEVLRPLLNEGWNGGRPHRIIRIARGIEDIKSVTLSILGGIQPDVLASNFKDELQRGMGSDGMLARFQLCSIYSTKDLVEPDPAVNMGLEGANLESLVRATHEMTKIFNLMGSPSAATLVLSLEANEIYIKYTKKIQTVISDSENLNQAYLSHIGKFGRLVLSLTGQFHILDSILNNTAISKPVDAKWVQLAVDWANYMDNQAKTLYFSISKSSGAKVLLSRIKSGEISDRMTVRSIYRKGWAGLQTPDEVLSAIETISDSNWIKVVTESPKGGGRKTDVVRLNPFLTDYIKAGRFHKAQADKTDVGGV